MLLEKMKKHATEFLIFGCLLMGLLYSVTTAYKTSIELKLIKEQSQKREAELKENIKAIKGALFLVMSKTEGITDEQIKDFVALSLETEQSRMLERRPPENSIVKWYWEMMDRWHPLDNTTTTTQTK